MSELTNTNDFVFINDADENKGKNDNGELIAPKRRLVPTRTLEAYNEMIDHVYYEEHTNSIGETRTVKVTVLKPEVNPLEFIKPVFVYGTH